MRNNRRTLINLSIGEEAEIIKILSQYALRNRLKAMGLIEGKRVKLIRKAAFLGPLQIRIGTTDLIIRRKDAFHIIIE